LRLAKFVAHCGVASRRKAEGLILHGRIQVNGAVVLTPQYNIEPEKDTVTFDDRKDRHHRKLARDLINIDHLIYPVGRLDYDSEGLMIFTNDGEFANRIMHPRNGVEKEYLVKMKGNLSQQELERVLHGIQTDDLTFRVKSIEHMKRTRMNSWYLIVVTEGRNRMIRRIGDAINHPVLKLKRTRIGGLKIGSLLPSEYRSFIPEEVEGIVHPMVFGTRGRFTEET
jgi:23S rRNA pseudouridine2605 synthase